jgi:hypothetical protein
MIYFKGNHVHVSRKQAEPGTCVAGTVENSQMIDSWQTLAHRRQNMRKKNNRQNRKPVHVSQIEDRLRA